MNLLREAYEQIGLYCGIFEGSNLVSVILKCFSLCHLT